MVVLGGRRFLMSEVWFGLLTFLDLGALDEELVLEGLVCRVWFSRGRCSV